MIHSDKTFAKINFPEDSATQMVEVIWPLSMVPSSAAEGTSGRCVLPLRTYIEETLRRSRTSYSTLQVALYYLILIKPFVPNRDFTMEQSGDCPANRALMCGRRMFLAALILASKYLQDRNYSAKAWSKMSGLPVKEINANERTFLAKIGWKLHVAKPLFDRWTDVVIKYQTMPPPASPGQSIAVEEMCWKKLVPMLTPELDNIPLPERMAKSVMESAACAELPLPALAPTQTKSAINALSVESTSQETTPTPASIFPPRFLEPRPNIAPPTPALARMGPLPTPQMTPSVSSIASSTPAVSANGTRRPSICSAMAFVQRAGFNRCVSDDPHAALERYQSRRQSVSSTLSSRSSPESMISDHSRSSRASSISSVTTVSSAASCVAPPRANLARLATTRNARMPLSSADVMEEDDKENKSSNAQPIVVSEDEEITGLSPPDFSVSQRKLPNRHTKQHRMQQQQQQPTSAPAAEKSRKRHRPTRGNRRNDLYDEVRFQLQEEAEDEDVQMLDLVSNDSDEDMTSPSPAVAQASAMLRRDLYQCKEAQTLRLPVQKNEGKKRTCCDTSARLGFGLQAVYSRA